jgi:zinc transporter ZupT
MTSTNRSSIRRVLIWSLGVGCASALIAVKEATTFGASDWQNIVAFFAGGCVLGCLLGLLTTAYNQKRKSAFHIWGWALLLGLFGLAFNTGTTRGYLLGALIGAVVGLSIGSLLYFRVARVLDSSEGVASNAKP